MPTIREARAQLPGDAGESGRERAEGSMDEDALTCGKGDGFGERDVRHDRVGDGCGGEGRVDVVGLGGDDTVLVADEDGRIPARAVSGQHRHLLAHGETRDPLTDGAHGAGDLQARHVRRLRQPFLVLVQALPQVDVDEPHRGVGDVDRDLSGTGQRIGQVDEGEHGWIAEAGDLDSLHEDLLSITHGVMR
nr:hypothetical protein [Streptomyces sp. 3212.3]